MFSNNNMCLYPAGELPRYAKCVFVKWLQQMNPASLVRGRPCKQHTKTWLSKNVEEEEVTNQKQNKQSPWQATASQVVGVSDVS